MKNKYYIGIIIILFGCLVGCELPTHTHKYINGLLPKLIENSEGTMYLGIENANGYIFEPIKLPFSSHYNDRILYDGKYILIENKNIIYYI